MLLSVSGGQYDTVFIKCLNSSVTVSNSAYLLVCLASMSDRLGSKTLLSDMYSMGYLNSGLDCTFFPPKENRCNAVQDCPLPCPYGSHWQTAEHGGTTLLMPGAISGVVELRKKPIS